MKFRKIMKKLYHTLAHNFENSVFLFIGIGFFGFELSFKLILKEKKI